MLWKRIKVWWWESKMWVVIIAGIGVLCLLTVWGLSQLESFFAAQIVYTLPLEFLKIIGYSVIGAYFWFWFMFKMGVPLSSSNSNVVNSKDIKITFNDVIGLTEAKREAMEVVALIKDRARVKKIGGKVIRGILMMGPPGCGKTYLAKAIASESGVPFLSLSGSEFVEVFVGVGAGRVRKLFRKARSLAYMHGAAIIFIDELDAVGQQRKFSSLGSQESDTTLNQLLVNMDGLSGDPISGNVIVIGASNAMESTLDPALLRPGRFDRIIPVSRPRLRDREDLFRYYMKKVKADPTIDLAHLARKTVWKTPADIENIIKEAALIAIRYNRDEIIYKDIAAAIERVDLGMETHLELVTKERERVAYHESGHLLVLYRQHPTDDVFKASIKTRGGALGVVYHHPREELYTQTREELLANLKTSLAGYVAEKVKYNITSTGVGGDFATAMGIASSMVWHYGMSSNGFVGDYTLLLGSSARDGRISEQMKNHLNNEVQALLHQAVDEVEKFLRSEWPLMDVLAQALLDKNELEYDEIEEIFKAHGKERIRG